jgi:hypothetical protein
VCGADAFGTGVVCGLLETTQQILSFEVSHSFNFLELQEFRSCRSSDNSLNSPC